MDRLPALFPGHSPNLLGTPAAALPGNDGGGPAGSGAVSSDRKRHSASCLTLAGSAGSRRDPCAGIGGCLAVACGQLEARMDRVLQRHYRTPANRRLANHLIRERDAMFTFLYCPGLEATNYRAEQAIRPMVVTRKVWGGNRTPPGAHTQSVVWLVFCTPAVSSCGQQFRRCQAAAFSQT